MRYNWTKLKIQFINGDYKNLREFAERKKIPYKTMLNAAKGWASEKREKDGQKVVKIGEKIQSAKIDEAVTQILSRNQQIQGVTDKLLRALSDMPEEDVAKLLKDSPKAFLSLTSGLVNIQKVHRIADGLDKDPEGTGSEHIGVEVTFVDASNSSEGD